MDKKQRKSGSKSIFLSTPTCSNLPQLDMDLFDKLIKNQGPIGRYFNTAHGFGTLGRTGYHIFCSMAVYPVIPKGMILIRLIPTAAHTEEDVAQTLDAFGEVVDKLRSGYYRKQALQVK